MRRGSRWGSGCTILGGSRDISSAQPKLSLLDGAEGLCTRKDVLGQSVGGLHSFSARTQRRWRHAPLTTAAPRRPAMHSHRAGIPNPSLIAILLVVRSTSGVNFVFHYPAKPSYGAPAVSRRGSRGTTTDYGGTDSSTSATPSSSDAEPEPDTADVEHAAAQSVAYDVSESAFSRHHRRHRVPRSDADSDDSDDAFARRGDGGIPWDTVLGFKTEFLAGLLAPRAALCRTRFELSVDDLVFLGFPLHVRPDGSWRKRRPRRPRKRRDGSRSSDDEGGDGTGAGEADDEEEGDEGEEADDEAGGNDDDDGSGDANSPSDGSAMSMFHLVFVLNPPELEYAVRTQEMFDFVVRRFTRALKHEQAKDGYVWREAEKITRVKEQGAQKGMSLHPAILEEMGLTDWGRAEL